MSLSDPITTDRVPYGHGGLIGEAAAKVVGDHSFLEVSSATVAPLNRGRIPGDSSHDAPTRWVCTCAHSYIRQKFSCCVWYCSFSSLIPRLSRESLGMRIHTSITSVVNSVMSKLKYVNRKKSGKIIP